MPRRFPSLRLFALAFMLGSFAGYGASLLEPQARAAVAPPRELARQAQALATIPANSDLAAAVNPTPAAAAIPTKLTLAGTASGSTTPGAGKCLRVSCTVAASYRVGSGAQTAVADDNQLPAATPERLCLSGAQDSIAFYTASAGACYVAVTGS